MTTSRHARETEDGSVAALALGIDALRIGRLLRARDRWPARWREAAFWREVERERRPLASLRSQGTLAAMYADEPFHRFGSPIEQTEGDPTRLAYALRWLELRDGELGPNWAVLLG